MKTFIIEAIYTNLTVIVTEKKANFRQEIEEELSSDKSIVAFILEEKYV